MEKSANYELDRLTLTFSLMSENYSLLTKKCKILNIKDCQMFLLGNALILRILYRKVLFVKRVQNAKKPSSSSNKVIRVNLIVKI